MAVTKWSAVSNRLFGMHKRCGKADSFVAHDIGNRYCEWLGHRCDAQLVEFDTRCLGAGFNEERESETLLDL